IAEALLLTGERGENAAGNAEVGNAHVRAFLGLVEAQCNAAKVVGSHSNLDTAQEFSRIVIFHSSDEPVPGPLRDVQTVRHILGRTVVSRHDYFTWATTTRRTFRRSS